MKKRKIRSRKTLSSWLTNRYVLVLRNEENFAEKSTLSFTYAKVIVFIFAIFTIVLFISLYLVKSILAQWFDPRHSQIEFNKQLIELSMNVDSLSQAVETKDMFIANLTGIIKGEESFSEPSPEPDSLTRAEMIANLNKETDLGQLAPIDSQFRKEFEQSGVSLLNKSSSLSTDLQEIIFFTPVNGIVSSQYNAQTEHYGVDIVAKDNEPIKAVADGSVIFSGWTQEYGYVIMIQHRGDLISVYKHNSELLEKVGNFVRAGSVIAIIGNTGELTTGPHLHFELWYNGNPVDPEEFVSF